MGHSNSSLALPLPAPLNSRAANRRTGLQSGVARLTPNRQAAIALAYERLPGRKNSAEWRGAFAHLCEKYDVCAKYPARLAKRLSDEGKLPNSRKGMP
eukprot:scaffold119205_cov28-Tisochrysis_lutea.AAC.1